MRHRRRHFGSGFSFGKGPVQEVHGRRCISFLASTRITGATTQDEQGMGMPQDTTAMSGIKDMRWRSEVEAWDQDHSRWNSCVHEGEEDSTHASGQRRRRETNQGAPDR